VNVRFSRAGLWDCAAAAVAVPLLVLGTVVASRTRVPPFRALDLAAYGLLVVAGLALAGRSRHPSGVLAVTLACCAAMLARHYAYGPVFLPMFVALSTVVTRHGLRRGLAATGLAGTVLLVGDIAGWGRAWVPGDVGAWVTWYASVLLPFAVGAVIRIDRDRRAAAAHAEEERRLRKAQDERLAIAREVHDVLSHSLSVISMRAGVALHVAHRRPEQALAALEAIRQTSREALNDLRTTLDIMRSPTPQTGGRVGELVRSVRAAGQRVELVTSGDPGLVPGPMGHVVHRIVQEALTNVVRHAAAATAIVVIDYGPDEVTVSVTDDGAGRQVGPPGNGITGMRERAAAVRGTVTAGPRPEGGYAVHARLPLGGEGSGRDPGLDRG
jgi:signal transduction histidine kinase